MTDWVDANGISVRYALDGTAGPTVVLLHEMGGSLDSWDNLAPELVQTGYRVLRYDQRGCGGSEKPPAPLTQRVLADDLLGVLDVLQVTAAAHLVAVAASCVPALEVAAAHPDRVASLTLCNPVTGVTVERGAALAERAATVETAGMRAALPVTLDRSWPADRGDPVAYRRYRARYLGNDPACFAAHNRALIGVDVGPAVAGLRCPVLVVAGEWDRVRPAEASRAFAQSLPAARFATIDAVHMMPAQAPAALAAVLSGFLAEEVVPR